MTRPSVANLGLGIGWRPELALWIERRADLGFAELLAEDFDADRMLPAIDRLRARGARIVPHGVSLSLGGAEPICRDRLKALGRVAERVEAPLVSEHIAFVRGGGLESGHLLPLPRTRDALDVVVANIREAKAALPVPLAVENIACLFEWPNPQMDEATFLTEIVERADVSMLLDVANLYANARNHGYDPGDFLDRIPLNRIAYIHVAGGAEDQGLYHDTHAHEVNGDVLELLADVYSRTTISGVMLERDDRFPSDAQLNAELDSIASAIAAGAKRRKACASGAPQEVQYGRV